MYRNISMSTVMIVGESNIGRSGIAFGRHLSFDVINIPSGAPSLWRLIAANHTQFTSSHHFQRNGLTESHFQLLSEASHLLSMCTCTRQQWWCNLHLRQLIIWICEKIEVYLHVLWRNLPGPLCADLKSGPGVPTASSSNCIAAYTDKEKATLFTE